MTRAILLIFFSALLCLAMVLPYLPGRYDASAAALSFAVQVGSYASLVLAPVGLLWLLMPRRADRWRSVAFVLSGLVALVSAVAALMSQLAMGMLVGICAVFVLGAAYRRSQVASGRARARQMSVPLGLILVPLALIAFRSSVLPRAAVWSRDRAIQHSAALIAEIESFRQRRGHYPISLQSLNPDFPTGVIGIERFRYEPSGEAYNLFFVRPHIELDAQEVVMFNPRDEHRFTSHELDILQYEGEHLDQRRGDRRRTRLRHRHWISILFD